MTSTYHAENVMTWFQVLVPVYIVVGNYVWSFNSVIKKISIWCL